MNQLMLNGIKKIKFFLLKCAVTKFDTIIFAELYQSKKRFYMAVNCDLKYVCHYQFAAVILIKLYRIDITSMHAFEITSMHACVHATYIYRVSHFN